MPKVYSRTCNFCGDDYTGRGEKYCSPECAQEAQKKDAEKEKPFEDIPPAGGRKVQRKVENDTLMATVTARETDAIKTLPELLEICEVDTNIWEVEKWQSKNWNAFYKDEKAQAAIVVPLFSVSARFKRRKDADFLGAIDSAIEKMTEHAPSYPEKVYVVPEESHSRYMLELPLSDLHLGMLAWDRETGEDYDSQIAVNRYLAAIDDILVKTSPYHTIEEIVLICGNDFFHTDKALEGKGGTTTRGTPQDVDSRRAKMIETGCNLLVAAIDKLLAISPVTVLCVPGNHDYNEAINAGRYLKAWYRNCEDVTVNAEPNPRKYHRYGNSLIGFTHGSEEKVRNLPMIMANEKKMDWAQTDFHEFHLGHIHRRKEYTTVSVNEEVGVRTRHLSALTSTDSWHSKRGYVANVRGAQAFLWNYQTGLVGIFNYNVQENNP